MKNYIPDYNCNGFNEHTSSHYVVISLGQLAYQTNSQVIKSSGDTSVLKIFKCRSQTNDQLKYFIRHEIAAVRSRRPLYKIRILYADESKYLNGIIFRTP